MVPVFIDSQESYPMSLVINTNVSSLNAQRNLDTSQASLQTSLQRLSSGLRINSAKDDAAGLAISDRFTAQINGTDQASRNANDGISLAQTADGSLSSITDDLQRIRQLAVQSANATNSTSDRAALNTEVTQLKAEIDRTAGSASFNGVQLLDGSNPSFVFQVGANTSANDTITVSGLVNATTAGLGSVTSATVQSSAISGLTTTAIAGGATDFVKINGTDIGALAATGTSSQRAAQLVDAINAVSTTTNVNAYVDNTSGKVVLSSSAAITVAVGGTGATGSGLTAATTAATTVTGLTSLDVSSFSGAQLAINQVDSALSQIDSARATLGAVQNRFSSVVTNRETTNENLSASRSRIQDADFAAETANLTKAQILQQAGTAILAQANSIPNNVLTLLKG
jgi:flagellin